MITYTMDHDRIIETAFPLRETSLDAVHEKNVRHGHISTLHIWPARRPLAASRAALIATLLEEPSKPEERKAILEKIGGKRTYNKKGKETTEGGVLHWKRETSPLLRELRERIHAQYPDGPPVVMDPFAGGGSIPLEAMRLGCKAVAADLNPVAWFILKCTLDYPQRLAGQKRPFPDFARQSPAFLRLFLKKTTSLRGKRLKQKTQEVQQGLFGLPEVGLDWHLRAWGFWVLEKARADLRAYYPKVDGKMTVAYLWARTVTCKDKKCNATIPLLKTRWLCKKEKRVLLTMEPNADKSGVVFGIEEDVDAPYSGAKLREYDKKHGAGTMSRAGVKCPCCNKITLRMDELREEGQAGRMGAVMTAVVVDGEKTKEYRLPTDEEREAAERAGDALDALFAEIPFGLPDERTPEGGSGASRAFSVDGYGFDRWSKLFTPRQLLALGTFVKHTRAAREAMREAGYPEDWVEAIGAYLALAVDRLAERSSTICHWDVTREGMVGTFQRYALQMSWDFAESMPLGTTTGGYFSQTDWVARVAEHTSEATKDAPAPKLLQRSALEVNGQTADVILTDPPYYDAIPYAALMDFFYVWLRRSTHGLSPEIDRVFREPLSPKWDHESRDGELIDDSSRFDGDSSASKKAYEEGMYRAFRACYETLRDDGRLVIVFAHKKPDAWETLVSALIRAGFIVTASWPIQTEMGNRTRAQSSAALSSSIWLVCRKRDPKAQPGWDTKVLAAMQEKIQKRLREFWDMGVRGPDFVWAATGQALEAYSAHPFVRKTGSPGAILSVGEFLEHARRMVLDFAVGNVLTKDRGSAQDAEGLDDVTVYYLLHRKDFGLQETPVGASILYAVSCNLKDTDLIDGYDLLTTGKKRSLADELDEDEEDTSSDDSSTVRLKAWNQRRRTTLGHEAPGGKPIPLIDQVHRLMHLYKAGDVSKVDEYIRRMGLAQHPHFAHVVQAIIEMNKTQTEEKSLLEAISTHLRGMEQRSVRKEPTLFE